MCDRINKTTNLKVLILITNIVLLLPLLIFCGENYSIDSYAVVIPFKHCKSFIGSFRWFGAFLYKIYTSFGHNPVGNCTLDVLIFIFLVAIGATVLTFCFLKINSVSFLNIPVICLSVIISVVNDWFCEIVSFPECIFISGIGFLLVFSSVVLYTRKSFVYKLISFAFLVFAIGIYQQFISVFCVYIITVYISQMTICKEFNAEKIVFSGIKTVGFVVSAGAVSTLIGKLVQSALNITPNERAAFSVKAFFQNLFFTFSNSSEISNGGGYFESELFTILLALLLFMLCRKYLKAEKLRLITIILAIFLCALFNQYCLYSDRLLLCESAFSGLLNVCTACDSFNISFN